MEKEINGKNESTNIPQGNNGPTNNIPPSESSRFKTSYQECPLGKEWDFIWNRFLRAL